MHDECSGIFQDGKLIAGKVRKMGFDTMVIPVPLEIHCSNCDGAFQMKTMITACPECRMVYAVTPCKADAAGNVMAAGIDY